VRRADGSYEDLPKWMAPTLFRPLRIERYPDPLPPPAALTGEVDWRSAHPVPMPPDDPLPLDWPRPYASPPGISLEEVEVRVLRGLKTERARAVDGVHGPLAKTSADVLAALQGGGAITVNPWEPTRIDIGDWETAVGWLQSVDKTYRTIIRAKSMDHSFRQIGERFMTPGRDRHWVKYRYHTGMEEVWKVANATVG
jgi:hypothetical protein